MGSKRTNVLLHILLILSASPLIQTVTSSVIHKDNPDNALSSRYVEFEESVGRVFYSTLGDVLMRLPFLPITLNIPDVISSVQGVFSYFSGSQESSDEPRDVLKLVRSALEINNFEDLLEEDISF